jgi:hypothetical protein
MITPTKAFSQMSVQEIISLAQPDSEYNEVWQNDVHHRYYALKVSLLPDQETLATLEP